MVGRLLWVLVLVALSTPRSVFGQSSVHDFQLSGSASVISEDCIRLTPDLPYVSGSAWFKRAIDLTRPFEMRMSLVLGSKNEQGADGIVFVFHPRIQTGFRGEGMGFAGLRPSLGIEFDTYRNVHLNDPQADHLAVMLDGQRFHGESGLGLVELDNLEDGARHPLRITWDPQRAELSIYLDEKLRAAYRGDVIKRVFGGQTQVYWGMTAGTGRLSNDQDVCLDRTFLSV